MRYMDNGDFQEPLEPQSTIIEGYPFGNKILPVGTRVEIGQHESCISDQGIIRQIGPDHMRQFVVACMNCSKIGLQVIRQVAAPRRSG